jgi:excisionase family DNA binding protein
LLSLYQQVKGGGKMLSAEELQQQLSISRSTLYRLRKEGLPHTKVGYRTIRYDLVQVLEWLEKKGIRKND